MKVELRAGGVTLHFYPDRLPFGEIVLITGVGEAAKDIEGRVRVLRDGVHLSYARTDSLTVAAVCDVRVGVDAERQRPRARAMEMARRYFTQEEVEYLEARGTQKRLDKAFWAMWTAKEAYSKATGVGLMDVLGSVPFTPAPLKWWTVKESPIGPVSVRHIYFNDVMVAVCVAREVLE